MSDEKPAIRVPAVPPAYGGGGGEAPPPRVQFQVADLDTGLITDAGTGAVVGQLPARRCAYVAAYGCACDDPAQCPVLREHPAEAALELAARRKDEMTPAELDGQLLVRAATAAAAGIAADAAAELTARRGVTPPAQQAVPAVVHPAPPTDGRPMLLHSGSYGLYLTPEGAYHLVYQRTAGTNPETGEVVAIDGAPQIHARDLPERAASIVALVMDRDTPLPPMVESLLFGDGKPPRALMAAMRAAGLGGLVGDDDA